MDEYLKQVKAKLHLDFEIEEDMVEFWHIKEALLDYQAKVREMINVKKNISWSSDENEADVKILEILKDPLLIKPE